MPKKRGCSQVSTARRSREPYRICPEATWSRPRKLPSVLVTVPHTTPVWEASTFTVAVALAAGSAWLVARTW